MKSSSFSVSVDATSYIYASEIFPTPVRAKGLSVSISGLFIATIVFLQSAPTAFANIGWKYYLVFICITATLFVVVWLYFPEVSNTSVLGRRKAGREIERRETGG
jgi:predicted MFS family arabinose efflux permease